MKKTKLAKAVAIAATGAVLSLGVSSVASAKVMYNTGIFLGTDGWTYSNGKSQVLASQDEWGTVNPWKGTDGGARPFGFVGLQALSWAASIPAGSVQEVSQANSIAEYGFSAQIDTANGSWGSWQDPDNPANTRGWGHNTDFGLIKADIDTDIRVDVSKVNPADDINNFGITVFTGMDDGTASFNHHGLWNDGYISGVLEDSAKKDDPFGTNGLAYLTHGDQGTVTFHATAGQVYSIYLGGNDVGGNIFGDKFAYKATINAVPVPAAAWLFGSGLIGLVSLGRRKQK